MVSSHPYNMWSLHVKLFTEEALEAWKGADHSSDATPLPVGFTSSVELEGVDGKGGETGAGRNGPIDVTDGNHFFSGAMYLSHRGFRQQKPLRCLSLLRLRSFQGRNNHSNAQSATSQ